MEPDLEESIEHVEEYIHQSKNLELMIEWQHIKQLLPLSRRPAIGFNLQAVREMTDRAEERAKFVPEHIWQLTEDRRKEFIERGINA